MNICLISLPKILMYKLKKHIVLIILVFLIPKLNAQIITETDSLKTQKDGLVEKIVNEKERSGVGKLIRRLFVKKSGSSSTKKEVQQRILPFSEAEGKIIRNIEINTLDPFGYSIEDLDRVPDKFIEKAGNTLHPKTKNFVINNYLLFEKGNDFDSLKILETERLIRQQRFSRKVRIDYNVIGDSVDLVINSLDSWTLFPTMTFSGSKVGFRLRERNFMGFGHDFDNYYRQNFETGKNRFQTRYTIPNIQRTFISFGVGYSSNEESEFTKAISVQRRFFSPFARWAGGVYLGERAYLDSIPNEIDVNAQEIKYRQSDFWAGYAFRLFDSQNPENRLTNLVVSGRYFNVNYRQTPEENLDPVDFYSNQDFILLGVGISKRNFKQDKFIRNYNIVEDIPVGMTIGMTGGMQRKNNDDRFYLAGSMKMGEYFKFGYAGFNLQYGGFLKSGRSEQSVFSLQIDYFTRLMSWGRWKFRSFVSSDLIIGNNRVNSRGDRLTLNENDPLGINGFYSVNVIGTKKWLTNFQVQSYSPYQLLGFRLSPIFSSSFGLISDKNNHLTKGKLYTRIGLGLLLTNDFLVFSNFQVSFSWYNQIPGHGENLFKTNTLQVSDFELMNFDFGKPELIEYSPFSPR